jgi:ABC-type Fe3+/spermidine/putrescine transport system ATPase subunit
VSDPGAGRPLVDVRIEALSTRTGPDPHLADVSLHVRYGEFLTVLGPPRSGKTAVLRAVAGLEPLAAGRVLVDGVDVTGVPAQQRGMGFVFDEGALWPHLDVREHVAFGLRLAGLAVAQIDERVAIVLGRLGLTDVATRRPEALTLENRRRLALARALAVEPRVLLLDEPLAHLEPAARKTLRMELARLHADLAVTTLCATRDAVDALALSDRIAVMGDGRVLQVGDAESLYRRPATRAVAQALGPANLLAVRVVEVRELGVVVETEAGDRVPVGGIGQFRQGDRGLLVLRPETLLLTEAAEARGPGIPGQVVQRVFEGARWVYEVDVRIGAPIRAEVVALDSVVFRLGDRVRVGFGSDNAVLVPADA